MKRSIFAMLVLLVLLLVIGLPAVAGGGGGGINNPAGVPLYVIIEVDWDGQSAKGDWTVWGPRWDPSVGGTVLASCTACLAMNYQFTFHDKTVQFDEAYVSGVDATPQIHHVVLRDVNGDGTYTGSLSAARYTYDPAAILYLDRIDYTITFDEDDQVTTFRYLQYEHKKMAK